MGIINEIVDEYKTERLIVFVILISVIFISVLLLSFIMINTVISGEFNLEYYTAPGMYIIFYTLAAIAFLTPVWLVRRM